MTFWFPEHIVRHNELIDIYGDSPYNHVANNVYQALIDYGGYSPSAANPFVTADYVDAAILSGAFKAAYGRGNIGGFTVDLFLGLNTNGTYSGDDAFNFVPKGLSVAPRGVIHCDDTAAGNVTWPVPSTFSVGFTQGIITWVGCMFIDEFAWIAVGQ